MDYLPIFISTSAGSVAIVGSSHAALSKLRLLRSAGANVRWFPCAVDVAEEVVLSAPGRGRFEISMEDPAQADLSGIVAVIASAGEKIDGELSGRLRAAGVPVNVIDRPALSSFIFPAIVDRGSVQVAIGTGGSSPVLARRLRERLETMLPARIGDLSDLIGRYRAKFAAAGRKVSPRLFWERVIDGPIGALALSGQISEAERRLLAEIDAPDTGSRAHPGIVHLVGAGPGDPDLLTLRAAQVLADADIVFYDELVTAGVLERARRDADRVFVGKRSGRPGIAQQDINRRLVEAARSGQRVVRLKGGDPFIFGRGGEELEALRDADIPVVIVPGISAALGCAAESGLPLTFRQEATQLTFITAHRADEADAINWAALADPAATIVVYMGLQSAAAVRNGLIAAGRSAQTPATVLARGTRPNAGTEIGVLADLPAMAAAAGEGPALLVIGDVVARSTAWRAANAAQSQRADAA